MNPAAFIVIWQYQVRPGRRAKFERIYGPRGDWARLFARAEGYLGTELLRAGKALHYVTIDRWASRSAYHLARKKHARDYRALDKFCEQLTQLEKRVGWFTVRRGE